MIKYKIFLDCICIIGIFLKVFQDKLNRNRTILPKIGKHFCRCILFYTIYHVQVHRKISTIFAQVQIYIVVTKTWTTFPYGN